MEEEKKQEKTLGKHFRRLGGTAGSGGAEKGAQTSDGGERRCDDQQADWRRVLLLIAFGS